MFIFLIITFLTVFVGMKAVKPGEFNTDYISRDQSTAINGLFTVLVFLSHVCNYISLDGVLFKARPKKLKKEA